MLLRTLVILSVGMALAACDSERRSVEYFVAHPDEVEAKLAECRNDPGANDPECANARAAQSKITAQRLREEADRLIEENKKRNPTP